MDAQSRNRSRHFGESEKVLIDPDGQLRPRQCRTEFPLDRILKWWKKNMLDTLDTSQSNGKKILMMGTDESSKLREASKTAGQKTLSYTFFL